MENFNDLNSEYQQLVSATGSILQRFKDGYIDLDDIIEELRPIRMRMSWITSKLIEKNAKTRY